MIIKHPIILAFNFNRSENARALTFNGMLLLIFLTATYNGEWYMSDQVKLIQKQSFINWRLFVSDNCLFRSIPEITQIATEDSRAYIIHN